MFPFLSLWILLGEITKRVLLIFCLSSKLEFSRVELSWEKKPFFCLTLFLFFSFLNAYSCMFKYSLVTQTFLLHFVVVFWIVLRIKLEILLNLKRHFIKNAKRSNLNAKEIWTNVLVNFQFSLSSILVQF